MWFQLGSRSGAAVLGCAGGVWSELREHQLGCHTDLVCRYAAAVERAAINMHARQCDF